MVTILVSRTKKVQKLFSDGLNLDLLVKDLQTAILELVYVRFLETDTTTIVNYDISITTAEKDLLVAIDELNCQVMFFIDGWLHCAQNNTVIKEEKIDE